MSQADVVSDNSAAPQIEIESGNMWITHPCALVIWLLASLLAAWNGWRAMAIFSAFVFILCCSARIWGLASLRRVACDINASHRGLFPGQRLAFNISVQNNKLLPMLWLEILTPYNPEGCIRADSRFVVRLGNTDNNPSYYCVYALTHIKWRQIVRFSNERLAAKRGVFEINNVELRSGDGFGLFTLSRRFVLKRPVAIYVYPALVGVSIEWVLKDIWDSRSSSFGSLEDTARVKSVRDYLPGDSARRINQRLLAKGQGLKVNQYELVAPDEVLFIFDSVSFLHAPSPALEESLSILASLICGLQAKGILVGLVVPAASRFPQTYARPSSMPSDLAHMLELLAAVQADAAPIRNIQFMEQNIPGQVYYIAFSYEEAASMNILSIFPPRRCQILVYEDEVDGRRGGEMRVRVLNSIKAARRNGL
ncbi:MAG: DUF58 domain-containing protein [Clostridiales bacterium]|jgi:uncharacterized protein (DUF58 family)|nr:DUF58 domain-containing protein [Clostridiales bacterium]